MKRRFTLDQYNLLNTQGGSVIENDDQEPYAIFIERAKDRDNAEGFSAHYDEYYFKILKREYNYEWFAAPERKDLKVAAAEFMGVFAKLDNFAIIAIREIIWGVDDNPLPERDDFQIQRTSEFKHKH